MSEQPFYEQLATFLERKGLYDPLLNDPGLLKTSISGEQIRTLNEVITTFYQRVSEDERLQAFHILFSEGKQIRFQKNLTRFTLFLMTLTYEEFLSHVFKVIIKHNEIGLDMHLLMEYFFIWNNAVTTWCCSHFDHEKKVILARNQKMNILAYLFINGYDKEFMDQFEVKFKAYDVAELEQHSELIKEHILEVDRLLESSFNVSKVDYFANMLTDIAKVVAASELQGKAVAVKVMKSLIIFIKKYPEEIVLHPAAGLLLKDIAQWLDHYSADVELKMHSRRFYLTGLTMEVELFKAYILKYEAPAIEEGEVKEEPTLPTEIDDTVQSEETSSVKEEASSNIEAYDLPVASTDTEQT